MCELNFKLADLEQGCNVTMAKKRDLSMREYSSKWQSFQEKFEKIADVAQIGNAGPVWQIKVQCQMQTQSVTDQVKEWCSSNIGGKASVFNCKHAAANMSECPIQNVRNALLHAYDVPPAEAKSQGYRTNWPDLSKKWSICMNDVVQARGKLDLDNLEMTIDLHDQPVNAALMKATIINIQQATVQGRDTSLVALNVKSCTLPNEKWGRVPRLN